MRGAETESLDGVLAQLVLLHLAARGHADRVEALDHGEITRHPEVGAAPLDEIDELGLGDISLERDEGGADLAEPSIGHAHDLRSRDRGMRQQHLLDLGRGDVLATDAEDVLGAADHAQATVLGQHADIAGAQPAVLGEHLGGFVRVLVVAAHHVPAAHLNLAACARRQRHVLRICNTHLDAIVRLRQPGDAQLERVAIVVEHDVGRGLRQAVGHAHLARAHHLDDVADRFWTRRRPAAA